MPGLTFAASPFPDDDGSADPEVARALTAYAESGTGPQAVLAALAGGRLLVPVVPMPPEPEATAPTTAEPAAEATGCRKGERETPMALPRVVGDDGRRALPAFTSAAGLARWRPDARPMPVPVGEACGTALDEGADALVIDLAGPVPFVIEGSRLQVLAAGGTITGPHDDPQVLAVVHAAVSGLPGVTGIKVEPGERAALAVRFRVAEGADGPRTLRTAAARLSERLRGDVTGGVEVGIVPGR